MPNPEIATKSPGQIAYEAHVAKCPSYPNGGKRATWEQLPDWARGSWERESKS